MPTQKQLLTEVARRVVSPYALTIDANAIAIYHVPSGDKIWTDLGTKIKPHHLDKISSVIAEDAMYRLDRDGSA